MGIISRMQSRGFSTDDKRLRDILAPPSTVAGMHVTEETAFRHAPVFAAVRILSEDIGSLPLAVYRTVGDSRIPARDHPTYRTLHRRPNPHVTAAKFWGTLIAWRTLYGEAYAEIVYKANDIELWPISPWRVHQQTRNDGKRVYWVSMPNGQPKVLFDEEILHFPGFGLDWERGLSPVMEARDSITLGMAAETYGGKFFASGGRPSGVLIHPGEIGDDEAIEGIRRDWESIYSGLHNSQRIAVLEEGMEWKAIHTSNEESQFLETRVHQLREVARIFRIPPHLLGDLEQSHYNNIEQQSIDYVRHAIQPIIIPIEQEIDFKLLPGDLYCKFRLQGLLRGDSEARAEYYNKIFAVGGISPNEIRELEDQNPYEGGDVYFVSTNFRTIENAVAVVLPPAIDPEIEGDRSALDSREHEDTSPDIPEPIPGDSGASDELRSIETRLSVQRAHLKSFREIARKIVKSEVAAIRAAVDEFLVRLDDPLSLEIYLRDFYDTFRGELQNEFRPHLFALGRSAYVEANREVGADEIPAELHEVIESYTKSMSHRHVDSSQGQLRKIMRESKRHELVSALDERLSDWEDVRPDRIADRETHQLGNAVTRFAWAVAGVTLLRWVAVGSESCDFCQQMDGKVVGIEGVFLRDGDKLQALDGQSLNIRGNKSTPPIHMGCECQIVAEAGARSDRSVEESARIIIDSFEVRNTVRTEDPYRGVRQDIYMDAFARLTARETKALAGTLNKGFDGFFERADDWYARQAESMVQLIEPAVALHLRTIDSICDPRREAARIVGQLIDDAKTDLRAYDNTESIKSVLQRWSKDKRATKVVAEFIDREVK